MHPISESFDRRRTPRPLRRGFILGLLTVSFLFLVSAASFAQVAPAASNGNEEAVARPNSPSAEEVQHFEEQLAEGYQVALKYIQTHVPTPDYSPSSNSEDARANSNERCISTLSQESADFSANGGSGRIGVATGNGCEWNVAAGIEWLHMELAKESAGPGAISYHVARNLSPIPRTAAIGIAGRIFTITQQGSQGLASR